MAARAMRLVVVGGGLAGVLVALALISRRLRRRPWWHQREDPADPPGSATSLSYGPCLAFSLAVIGGRLESCPWPAGFCCSGLVLHSWGADGLTTCHRQPCLAQQPRCLWGKWNSRRFTGCPAKGSYTPRMG